ncbi:MAG: hypothetical protein LLF89_04240 [Spirochaetaceae bacterium]|nr:hypothetical protein [Spirochaetaceae bacterium]
MTSDFVKTVDVASVRDFSFLPPKQWFSLKEACDLKGLNYKTACNRPYLQPNHGEAEA